jgi:hypothetical protein
MLDFLRFEIWLIRTLLWVCLGAAMQLIVLSLLPIWKFESRKWV